MGTRLYPVGVMPMFFVERGPRGWAALLRVVRAPEREWSAGHLPVAQELFQYLFGGNLMRAVSVQSVVAPAQILLLRSFEEGALGIAG